MSAGADSAFAVPPLPAGISSSLQPVKKQRHRTKLGAYGMPSSLVFCLADSEHVPLTFSSKKNTSLFQLRHGSVTHQPFTLYRTGTSKNDINS